ncbi:MAG: ATP synthase subunit I [Cardiobacteriaceae bacterium]|nr:ATP synthase subunit I [Cardiobacteriaceae bacterium]
MQEEFHVGQTIRHLASYQSRVVLVFLLLSLLKIEPFYHGLVAGSLVAWLATLSQGLIFQRLPEHADARIFFAMMIVAEVVKWLVVAVLIWVLQTIPAVQPLGLVLGFMTAYLSYFLLLLKG